MQSEAPITDAEMFIVRLLREASAAARTIADLRQALTTSQNEVAALKRKNDAQANAIETLSARVNVAEGRR